MREPVALNALSLSRTIERDGFALVAGVLPERTIAGLIDGLRSADIAVSTRGRSLYGARNILDVPEIAALASCAAAFSIVAQVIDGTFRAVRGLYFDKTAGANWPVAWHQDLTLAVAERHEVGGWGQWSTKAGVTHAQPPAEFLERMVTLRIHLDDCAADNGPLKVLPGTHKLGRIPAPQIQELRREKDEHVCIAPQGSALVMKPLLLHASSAASRPAHRRVIHLEFAPEEMLPHPLRWLDAKDAR